MQPSNPSDQNVMDGKLYYFNTSLNYGFYQFQISCSDGMYINSTGWIIGPEVNPFFGFTSGTIQEVAIFRTRLPWGYSSNTQILDANGINYDIFTTADLGTVSLSGYDKVIIPSVQDQGFYDVLVQPAVRTWLESYVSSGGVLEIHYCHYSSNSINGALSRGYSVIYSPTNSLTINPSYESHPIVDGITNDEIDNWSYSAHCYITKINYGCQENS